MSTVTLERPPFDAQRLDDLMDRHGIDVLVVTSKHNIQYLLGGYRFFLFETTDAIGTSRYLPALVYVKGVPEGSLYVGCSMESVPRDDGEFWTRSLLTGRWDSVEAIELVASHIKSLDRPTRRVGVELGFLPADAMNVLSEGLSQSIFVDAHRTLERLRAIKTRQELAFLRKAAEGVVNSMLKTFRGARIGCSKNDLVSAVKRAQVSEGLDFSFCQATVGSNFNRFPTEQKIKEGDVVSLDSVGSYNGYVGDLCRMAVAGQADSELVDILADIDRVQQAARQAIGPGVKGNEPILAGDTAVSTSPFREIMEFTVHGIGLINHEAPRLVSGRPLPYPADDARENLESGMVVSVETAVRHPKRGFIKLEDTLALTATGNEAYGDDGRGWSSIG
jgi:Xaa-Pro aminopeptidase